MMTAFWWLTFTIFTVLTLFSLNISLASLISFRNSSTSGSGPQSFLSHRSKSFSNAPNLLSSSFECPLSDWSCFLRFLRSFSKLRFRFIIDSLTSLHDTDRPPPRACKATADDTPRCGCDGMVGTGRIKSLQCISSQLQVPRIQSHITRHGTLPWHSNPGMVSFCTTRPTAAFHKVCSRSGIALGHRGRPQCNRKAARMAVARFLKFSLGYKCGKQQKEYGLMFLAFKSILFRTVVTGWFILNWFNIDPKFLR